MGLSRVYRMTTSPGSGEVVTNQPAFTAESDEPVTVTPAGQLDRKDHTLSRQDGANCLVDDSLPPADALLMAHKLLRLALGERYGP